MTETQQPRVTITRLIFSDGTEVALSPADVVLIVGPNNAGKSATLRAIRDKLQNSAQKSPVLKSLEIERSGGQADFINWLSGWTVPQTDSPPDNPVFQALGQALHQSQVHHEWQRSDHALGQLTRWFCHLLSADERLQICNPPGNIALARDNPNHPIHFLLRDDRLEMRMSSKFHRAFGVDLVVHRNAGSQVPLHIGERPTTLQGEDRVSISYIERLERLPTLHSQGDGMRSFAGVLLATSVGRESIMLIDEPEAFLHPPQARLLGTTLVQDRGPDRQLLIATHSTDVLRGVLDADSTDVRVIRIRRDDTINSVRLLSNDRIRQLWGDPLLRYSNILDGLFHDAVVVCEADADCRFYSAVLDATAAEDGDDTRNTRRPDLMFTHCGGKARLPMVVRALRELDVPVRVVADFDVLSDEQPLRAIAEALSVDWTQIAADWKLLKHAVESKKPDMKTADVKNGISTVLSTITEPTFPAKAKAEIQSILKLSSPWAHAKTVGKSFLPSGEPSRACERLLSVLRKSGLFVVEVGELEGFARTEGGHGPKWVDALLSRDLAHDRELEAARMFVKDLVSA